MVVLSRTFAKAGAFALGGLVVSSVANVSKNLSLRSQLPNIAHVGAEYNWTISADTFHMTGAAPVTLSAEGLPTWATFDATQLTFSGNPTADDENDSGTRVTVRATQEGQRGASDSFTLVVLDASIPTINKPLPSQLAQASSLGPDNILPGNILYLPLGWSFSVGFDGDTFSLPDGSNVYLSASLADSQPLPDWLKWSADSYTLFGVAPTQPGPEGAHFDFVLTGSNVKGFGGPSTSLTIVVATNETQAETQAQNTTTTSSGGSQTLSLAQALPTVNASVGAPISYTVPTTTIVKVDGDRLATTADNITVSANVSEVGWLNFDNASYTFSGTPPYDEYKDVNSTQNMVVPLVFASSSSNQLLANVTVQVVPFPFVAQTLPDISVQQGQKINQSLAGFVRDVASSSIPSNIRVLAASSNPLSVSFDPTSAGSTLQFNPKTLLLTGTLPKDVDRVKVNLQSTSSEGQSSTASFYLDQSNNSSSTKNTSSNDSSPSTMSPRARVALTATLSSFGGLCALILLLMCCRRHVAKEDHDTQGNILPLASEKPSSRRRMNDDDDDQTLADRDSVRNWKRAIVVSGHHNKKKDVEATPTTLADTSSPYTMHDEKLKNVSVEGHRPDGDEPTQNRLVAGLFGPRGQNKRRGNNGVADEQNAGLGLGLDTGNDPYTQQQDPRVKHSRSRQSVRSSWEQDLFYDDRDDEERQQQQKHHDQEEQHHDGGGSSGNSAESFRSTGNGAGGAAAASAAGAGMLLTAAGLGHGHEAQEIPRRRPRGGQPSFLQFRHRNTHINESPAFHAPSAFSPATSNAERSQPLAEEDVNSEDFHDSRTGLSNAGHEDAQILEARVMQVQRHSPMMHATNDADSDRHRLARISSRTADPMNVNGAFDDAEDELLSQHQQQTGGRRGDRSSVLSNQSHLLAIQNQVIYPPDSPNPSFMDGASVSNMDPRETMKPVNIPKQSQASQQRQQQQQKGHQRGSSSSSASSRFLPCPDHEAVPGQHVRFHIYPAQPPPMAGPPGSPGKRSGEIVRYALVVDDPQLPHLSLQWPDMMADWLAFDPSTFEASGWVPHDFANMGHIVIALVSLSNRAAKRAGHDRRTSTDSNATVINEDELKVCAKARLVFAGHAPPPHAF